ncbi:Uncharacterised protein [Enterobacter cloacae]|nr:Uncharacterised protein [Enterobacter cloacae]
MRLGEGHADHFHRAEDHPDGGQHQRQHAYRRIGQRAAGAAPRMGMQRRFGAALQAEQAHPGDQEQRRQQRPRLGEPADAEAHRQHRPDDVAHLVHHRFEGKRRVQLRRAPVQLGPARPHHGRHARHRPGEQGEQVEPGIRRSIVRTQQQRAHRQGAGQSGREQHPALAEAVHQARYLRREQGIAEHEGGRHGTGQPVVGMHLGKHGDDAQAGHRQGHPRQQAGG